MFLQTKLQADGISLKGQKLHILREYCTLLPGIAMYIESSQTVL